MKCKDCGRKWSWPNIISQNIRSLDPRFESATSQYEARMLITRPRCSIWRGFRKSLSEEVKVQIILQRCSLDFCFLLVHLGEIGHGSLPNSSSLPYVISLDLTWHYDIWCSVISNNLSTHHPLGLPVRILQYHLSIIRYRILLGPWL
jgi:hypothetical protein